MSGAAHGAAGDNKYGPDPKVVGQSQVKIAR